MSRASLLIQVEDNGKMGMQLHVQDDSCMLPLLGSIDMVKANIIQKMQTNPEYSAQWQQPIPAREEAAESNENLHDAKHNHYPAEQQVPRDEALAAYYLAFNKLRERIGILESSPKGTSWIINPAAINSL